MRRFLSVLLLFVSVLPAEAAGPSIVAVMASTNGTLQTPTNFFGSNVLAGTGITIAQGAGGKITITGTGTNAVETNFPSIYVTNYIEGTNYTFETSTNVPRGILTWERWTNLSGTLGGGTTDYPQLWVRTNLYGSNAFLLSLTVTNRSVFSNVLAADLSVTGAVNVSSIRSTNGYTFSDGLTQTNVVTNSTVAAGANVTVTTNVTGTNVIYTVASSAYGSSLTNSWVTNTPQTIYVATNGNDSWPGTLSMPKLTPSNALAGATAGQVIHLMPGHYTNDFVRHTYLHNETPIKLVNKTNVTVFGRGAVLDWPTGMLSGILIQNCDRITGLCAVCLTCFFACGIFCPSANISSVHEEFLL